MAGVGVCATGQRRVYGVYAPFGVRGERIHRTILVTLRELDAPNAGLKAIIRPAPYDVAAAMLLDEEFCSTAGTIHSFFRVIILLVKSRYFILCVLRRCHRESSLLFRHIR